MLRHSAAHVLAQAVQEVNPTAKLGIGPPITDGFYYDFDVDTPFTPEDLKAIEKVMGRIVKEGQTFRRWDVTEDEARAELRDEPYKLELIGLKGDPAAADGASRRGRSRRAEHLPERARRRPRDRAGRLAGPVPRPARPEHPAAGQRLPADPVARPRTGAGSEKNPQLQRVYGTAWPTKDELRAYLERIAEAERRDHRRLGTELDLFSFPDEIGSGPGRVPPQGRRHPHGDGALLAGCGTCEGGY